jgi:transmembrane sensor
MSAMHTRPAATPSDIDSRAREWLVLLLDKDVGPEDLVAWESWLDADSRHRAAYERVEDAWRAMQTVEVRAPTPDELARDRYQGEVSVSHWRKSWRGNLRAVAPMAASLVAVLAVVLAGWLVVAPHLGTSREFATQRARHMEASLQDGSRIQLGAMTTLKVDYRPATRDVGMVQGEALFHVAHDRRRPFIVHTPLAAITAVGTAFNVEVEAGAVTLTVTEGVVSVAPEVGSAGVRQGAGARSPLRIRAGQRLKMEKDGPHIILALSDAGSETTWLAGRLEYRNASLRSVISDVNRYTTKPIVVTDADLKDLQYTGTVQLDEADNWLLGLPAAFPITVELNGRGQFVLWRKAPTSLSGEVLAGGRAPGERELATNR